METQGRGTDPAVGPRARHAESGLRHEAFLYAGDDEFLNGCTSFIRDGRAVDEPVLVVVSARKIDLLRSALGADADGVMFADMEQLGRNPALIIPAWRDFVDAHGGTSRPLRGIGEPIWPGRSEAELIECRRHESLLNMAFREDPTWWLVCPYDKVGLDSAVIDEARRTHPFITNGSTGTPSVDYVDDAAAPFDAPLPAAPTSAVERPFGEGPLDGLRRFVDRYAADTGLDAERVEDLVLAANEVATNSVRHGGGEGTLRIWNDDRAVVCEVGDRGFLDYPLAGRERPEVERNDGRGLWLANHVCDLVQLRTYSTGTVVRLHMSLT